MLFILEIYMLLATVKVKFVIFLLRKGCFI